MKVIGVKTKTNGEGKITHSQIVRVNLVDSEHPFFSRIWHGVHVLDETSQLLTQKARKKIRENGGAWPKSWFGDPEKIRNKLDYHSLVRSYVWCLNNVWLVLLTYLLFRLLLSVEQATYQHVLCTPTRGILLVTSL